MLIDLQPYISGFGVEIGRGDCDRLGLLQHSHCLTIELFEESPFWLNKPDFVGVDGKELPFLEQHFDFVASSHVLEHMLDPISTLREWMRVLKIGGFLILALPDKDNSQYPEGVYLERHLARSTLNEVLEAKGRVLPEGRPRVEYGKDERGLNKFGLWVREWTGRHHWVWKLSDIVQLINYIGFEVVEAKYPHCDINTFCVIGKKIC